MVRIAIGSPLARRQPRDAPGNMITIDRSLLLAASCAALLAACSSPEEERSAPRDPAPALLPTSAPDAAMLSPGQWTISEDADGAHARFGPSENEPVLALECDAGTQALTLMRAGDADEPRSYVLEAGKEKARVNMAPGGGELPMLEAEINGALPIFEQFAQKGNIITVTAPEGDNLRLPGAPGIARVLNACSRS